MPRVIGIDLGTTNSAMAVMEGGEPTIIPGALHLMFEELEARHQEVPRDRDIVLYCT